MPEQAITKVFAARLKSARKAMGLTQTGVGLQMGLGEKTASARVNRWEKGVHPASLESAEALAEALGMPLAALVSRDNLMAEAIFSFALLPREQQKTLLKTIQRALGPQGVGEVRAKLATEATPKSSKKP